MSMLTMFFIGAGIFLAIVWYAIIKSILQSREEKLFDETEDEHDPYIEIKEL